MFQIRDVTSVADRHGAPICRALRVRDLPAQADEIETILPGARTVVVLAAPHSRSAIASSNLQVAQFDTIHTYNQAVQAARAVALWLERAGFRAAAIPSFLPIDMAPPKLGMQGAVDWRGAAVQAGLGGFGESGLLVTPEYGPAVRLGGLVTDAEVAPGAPLPETPCTSCGRCVDACPVGALSGGGEVDKKTCADKIFAGGYRAWRQFLLDLVDSEADGRRALLRSQISLELWQNFMTGIYYYCAACQASCPLAQRTHAERSARLDHRES